MRKTPYPLRSFISRSEQATRHSISYRQERFPQSLPQPLPQPYHSPYHKFYTIVIRNSFFVYHSLPQARVLLIRLLYLFVLVITRKREIRNRSAGMRGTGKNLRTPTEANQNSILNPEVSHPLHSATPPPSVDKSGPMRFILIKNLTGMGVTQCLLT